MKHLSPTRLDLYHKSITPKPKLNLTMITVEEACLFGEWLNTRYVRNDGFWIAKDEKSLKQSCYTTKQLWELYQQQVLGKRPVTDPQTDKK